MEDYIVKIPKSILITGGIGDFIILESFFKTQLRSNLETVYYATSQAKNIISLFEKFDNYPKLKNHVSVWDNFRNIFCFVRKEDLYYRDVTLKRRLDSVQDYSIINIFPLIQYGIFHFNFSSCIKYKLANIFQFDLPKKYVIVCPFSYDKRNKNRDFTKLEWENIIEFLRLKKLKGVILNNGNEESPESECLIDLSNRTTIEESIEITKHSYFYIGIDSCLSVIAAQVLEEDNLVIKSVNEHLYRWKKVYYPMKYGFSFLMKEIRKI